MKSILLPVISLLLFSLLFFAGSASALTTNYLVTSADADPTVAVYGGRHSIWIPGLSTDLDFDAGATLTLDDMNTASYLDDIWSLSGIVRDGNIAFEVAFSYSAIEEYGTAAGHNGTPKLELQSSAYVAPFGTGGPVDPSTWLYTEILNGTLTGLTGSTYDGAVLSASLMGPHGEFGSGANGKNTNLGLSNWMVLETTVQACDRCEQLASRYDRGDVNIDVNPIPEPSSAVLFAVGGFVVNLGIRRRAS